MADLCCLMTLNGLAAPETSSRQRVSLDNDWRFTKVDPTNSDAPALLYDVRPEGNPAARRPHFKLGRRASNAGSKSDES
jgi:hypothetical protein